MNHILIPTDAERALVQKQLDAGHIITRIVKSEAAFKVEFRYADSNAYGGASIIYNLRLSMLRAVTDIREREAQLLKIYDGVLP
jgi:hypothetical protein